MGSRCCCALQRCQAQKSAHMLHLTRVARQSCIWLGPVYQSAMPCVGASEAAPPHRAGLSAGPLLQQARTYPTLPYSYDVPSAVRQQRWQSAWPSTRRRERVMAQADTGPGRVRMLHAHTTAGCHTWHAGSIFTLVNMQRAGLSSPACGARLGGRAPDMGGRGAAEAAGARAGHQERQIGSRTPS